MKKRIFMSIFMVAVVAIAGWNISQSMSEVALSDVSLANVEALAGEINPNCPNGCVEGSGGCTCNGSYPQYKEATWH
jgi:hypothetical protein